MREKNVKLKDKLGIDAVYPAVSTVVLKTEDDSDAVFSLGAMTQKTVSPDFSGGDTQHVIAADDELFTDVAIIKPATLLPRNIAKDINVAGVVGTFEGGGNQPKLYTPSISRSGDTLTVSNNGSNGSFVQSYYLYNDGTLVKTQSSNSFSIKTLNILGNLTLSGSVAADKFQESTQTSTLAVTVFGVTHDLTELITDYAYAGTVGSIALDIRLRPITGRFLPEDIVVTMDGIGLQNVWDSYSGIIHIGNVTGPVSIIASAFLLNKLRRPSVVATRHTMEASFPKYAQTLRMYLDGIMVTDIQRSFSYEVVAVTGAARGFIYAADTDSYYSEGAGVNGAYAVCRLMLFSNMAMDLQIEYKQTGEACCDYGVISKPNVALSLDASVDSADKLTRNLYGANTSVWAPLVIPIPAGENFIDFKYRHDSSVISYPDRLEFRVIMPI